MTNARILDEHVDGLTHTFRVLVDAKDGDESVNARLRDIGRSIRISGFRPGRAPPSLVRKRYADKIRAEVVDRMAIDVARSIIVEKSLEPTRRPTLHIDEDHVTTPGKIVLTLVLEVMPDVTIDRLDDFRLRRPYAVEADHELAERADLYLRRQLFDALMAHYDFPVPGDMIQSELARITDGFEAQVGELPDEETKKELQCIAERRIRLAILLTEIGRMNGITVTREEVEALIVEQAEVDPDHRAEIIDYYLDHPTAVAELQSPLFENRVVEFLLARSRIEAVKLSPAELRRTLEQS